MKISSEIVVRHRRTSGRRAFLYRPGVLPSLLPLVLFAFIWPFGGGGRKVHMMAGSATPAAQGTVTIQTGNNGNTTLDLKVQALAAPSSLSPAANVYVVWIQPPDQNPQNHGQLSVNQSEDGELHTKTPYKRFKVFVTAEQNARIQEPTGPRVLQADVSQG